MSFDQASPGMPSVLLTELHHKVQAHFLLEDSDVIDVVCATVVANRVKDVPVWIVLVAPPSSLKTEIAGRLRDVPGIYFVDKLTEKTLISGKRDEDTGENQSLLPRLTAGNYSLLVSLDFGAVLSMRPEKRAELLQQLRHVYDGRFKGNFGTGDEVSWSGHLGFIGCATPTIDTYQPFTAALGDRFLYMRIASPDRLQVALRAQANVGKDAEVHLALDAAFKSFLAGPLPDPLEIPCDGGTERRIAALAALVTAGRSPVLRGRDGSIEGSPGLEGPGRVSKQLRLLAQALAAVRGHDRVAAEDFATVRRVGLDSVPPDRLTCFRILGEGPKTAREVATQGHFTDRVAGLRLEELEHLGLVEREPEGGGRWFLSGQTREWLDLVMDPALPRAA